MQNFILSLEGAFPSIYTQSKSLNSPAPNVSLNSAALSSLSHSSSATSLTLSTSTSTSMSTEEILPNKLPLKRRLIEFRFGRDDGSFTMGKKPNNCAAAATTTTFTTNPFAFDKFKDISPALTVHLYEDGVILEPGGLGLFSYSHPTIQSLLNSINNCLLSTELFITLFESTHLLSHSNQSSIFYDGCVVIGIVDWRTEMTLTIGNGNGNLGTSRAVGNFSLTGNNYQWARRVPPFNNPSAGLASSSSPVPEIHKVLLKPSPDCWQFALAFLASLPEGEKFAQILEDEESLLEFERQLILINEPLVCLDPSPTVMLAMNALHFDRLKHRLYQPITLNPSPPDESVFDALENTLINLAALKPQNSQSLVNKQTAATSIKSPVTSGPGSSTVTSPTSTSANHHRYRRISVVESWQDRERHRTTEPIYGIDHRRQFVKNRQPLPPSSFVPPNWRPFKTIRYEREIVQSPAIITSPVNNNNSENTNTNPNSNSNSNPIKDNNNHSNTSLAKLYYCVNVFYAPPPTYPPIQLFLQVGTTPDTSTSGFLHRVHFTNLVETENYLQNLRNLLLIENGNCNLKVITDISTTGTTSSSNSSNTTVVNSSLVSNNNNNSVNSTTPSNSHGQGQTMIRKHSAPTQTQVPVQGKVSVPLQARQGQAPLPASSSNPNLSQSQSQNVQYSASPASLAIPQFQLTPHQILQLNQRNSKDSMTSSTFSPESGNNGGGAININNNTSPTTSNNPTQQSFNTKSKSPSLNPK